MRQFDTFVKDQRRFHAAVGEKNAAAALRQVVSVFCHCNISVINETVPRYVSRRRLRSGGTGAA